MRTRHLIIFSAVISILFSAINNQNGILENLRFNLRLDRQEEIASIKAAVEQYNTNSAGFYNSAGLLAGLEEIPAAPLLKRRLFKDINMLKGEGLVVVFDKDAVEVTDVLFDNRDFAEVRTIEVWAISLQDRRTRKPVFNVKALEINVRYLFYKGRLRDEEKRWIVYEVDVYPEDEEVPELNIKPAIQRGRTEKRKR